MKVCERKLTSEEVEKAKKEGIYSLFSEALLIGYGVYSAYIIDRDGENILVYNRGESCD